MSKTCEELRITEFEVVWGAEKFSPIQFHTCDIGEIRIKVRPIAGDNFDELFLKALETAKECGQKQFVEKTKEFAERVKSVAIAARTQNRATVGDNDANRS